MAMNAVNVADTGGGGNQLDIGKATIGYDSKNLRTTYEKLRTSCIEETKRIMKTKTGTIMSYIDKAWVGTSAAMFKDNWERDVQFVSKKLDETSQRLEEQFNTIIKNMNAKEDQIVARRQGGVN